MSLLLTMAKQPVSNICIPRSLGDSFLPCNDESSHRIDANETGSCGEGQVPLVSGEGTVQLQTLILAIALFHVFSCLVTLALADIKINRWQSWVKETRTLEYQLSNDPRRFRLTRQTSFGQRHLQSWSTKKLVLWPVCFFRQFAEPVTKADYFALRSGFIKIHFSKENSFDFHKFFRRSVDHDFLMIVRISPAMWLYALLVIFFNAHDFYNHYWLPFIPLAILLAIGTKLEVIITKMCLRMGKHQVMASEVHSASPNDDLFWFKQPKWILHAIHFVIIQNSFQIAFFAWTWYKFGFQSCFHRETTDVVLTVGTSILVQLLCAYVTLPLYALVTQMGSSMKETVFSHDVVMGMKRWRKSAKRSLIKKKELTAKVNNSDSASASHAMRPLRSVKSDFSASDAASGFRYPSGRLELLEMQRVAEEIIQCRADDIPFTGELSFRFLAKKKVPGVKAAAESMLNR